MSFWENITNALKARKGEFTGTSGNESKIDKRISNNQSVNISNPTSYRTYHNVGQGTLDENDVDIGLTSGVGGEIVSTAIQNARYDPEDDSLNITYQGGDREYKFRAGGPEGVREWINAPSKGAITNEWRTTHRYPGY